MNNKCIECENESLLMAAEASAEAAESKKMVKLYEKCLDVKDELCNALRDKNENLENQINFLKEKLKDTRKQVNK